QLLPTNIIYLYVCPAVGSTCAYTMADMNIPANDAPAEQAPAIAPPTRTDDQILSAFTASSMISAIYIQQFWDTMCLIHLLGCTAVSWMSNGSISTKIFSEMHPISLPPTMTILLWLHLRVIRFSNMSTLWDTPGIIHRSNINYAEKIWEEFVQSIQTFLTDRKNLTTASRGKKKTAHLLIPNVMFTKLIIHHLKTKHDIHPKTGSALHYSHEENVLNTLRYVGKDGREIFGMAILDTLLTDTIKRAPYYNGYLEHVAEYQSGKVTKKRIPKSPLKLVDEPSDEGVRVKESAYNEEEANLQWALELSLKEHREQTQGPACPVVLREHDSRRIQPLSDVQGMGKEKVIDEQASHDLLTLQTLKMKSPRDQFIFQRRTPMPTGASGHAESPSLDAELALTDSEMESDNEVGPNPGDQDEGQARSNPGDAAESQPQSSHVVPSGPNLEHMDLEATDASTQQKFEQMNEEFTTTTYPNVQENLKLPTEDQVILKEPASSSGTLSSLQNLKKDLSFTDQFFVEKPQDEELGKTNAATKV
ncbi:retrovirus-related pol polyprotein from transposon TNT 1-94, partial [Tanacetum coccineum]